MRVYLVKETETGTETKIMEISALNSKALKQLGEYWDEVDVYPICTCEETGRGLIQWRHGYHFVRA